MLSSSVANSFKTLRELKLTTTDTTETERLCRMFDKFFDIFNTRSVDEAQRKLKPNLSPFYSREDPRLKVHMYFITDGYVMYSTAVVRGNIFEIFE